MQRQTSKRPSRRCFLEFIQIEITIIQFDMLRTFMFINSKRVEQQLQLMFFLTGRDVDVAHRQRWRWKYIWVFNSLRKEISVIFIYHLFPFPYIWKQEPQLSRRITSHWSGLVFFEDGCVDKEAVLSTASEWRELIRNRLVDALFVLSKFYRHSAGNCFSTKLYHLG